MLAIQVFLPPSSEYKVVREKLAVQKRNSRKGLSGLLAKTRPSFPVAGQSDPFGNYTGQSAAMYIDPASFPIMDTHLLSVP